MSNVKDLFMCSCGSEGLMLDILDEEAQEIIISLFCYKFHSKPKGFLKRLKMAFITLLTGEPSTDEVILDYANAKKFAEKILEIVNSCKKEVICNEN